MPRDVQDWASQRATFGVRVRIVKKPSVRDADSFDVSRFQVGHTYDVGPRLAEYLLACQYAVPAGDERDTAADEPARR